MSFTADRIQRLLEALNSELVKDGVRGEIFLAGGAVMCLVFRAREATKDVDALLVPASEMRAAARRVAETEGVSENWLNDAVKGFFSAAGRFEVYAEMSHLKVYSPNPEYLFAMKCLAMRLGEDFHDREDVSLLLKILEFRDVADAEEALARYYPIDRYPVRARYILEELLAKPA